MWMLPLLLLLSLIIIFTINIFSKSTEIMNLAEIWTWKELSQCRNKEAGRTKFKSLEVREAGSLHFFL